MQVVLKYPGGKTRLAPWITSYIPKHKVYLEPYAGGLAVLFNKSRSHIETINDLHGEVINYFKVLRDKSEELLRIVSLTPYSRLEYDESYTIKDNDCDVERARKFCSMLARIWLC